MSVSAILKYKFWPNTEAVIDTHVMLIVAIDTTCTPRGLHQHLCCWSLAHSITACSQRVAESGMSAAAVSMHAGMHARRRADQVEGHDLVAPVVQVQGHMRLCGVDALVQRPQAAQQ